jgi:hypothetical protein
MKDRNELPSAAEKGRLIAAAATRGLTGLALADLAQMTREEISKEFKLRMLEQKGVVSDNPGLRR